MIIFYFLFVILVIALFIGIVYTLENFSLLRIINGKAKVYEFWASNQCGNYYYIIYRKPGDWLGRYVKKTCGVSKPLRCLTLSYDNANKKMKRWADDPSEFEAHQKQCLEFVARINTEPERVIYKSQPE